MKVLIQYKKGGGIRVAGIDIGNYNGSWDKLFKKSIEVIKKFKRPFLLLTDGDTSIFESLKGNVTILVQRCLWHIPYQGQYVLWKDGELPWGRGTALGSELPWGRGTALGSRLNF